MKMKTMLALSGGIDSTTVLTWLVNHGHAVHCCLFHYGSKHNKFELAAAKNVYEYYSKNYPDKILGITEVDLTTIFVKCKSNLLEGQGQIPEGHYNDANMSKTVVPARNMVFLSVMAGLAESYELDSIAIGIHQGDHHIYPDCRPEFFFAMKEAVLRGTDGKISAIAPFLKLNKAQIVEYGLKHGAPYHLTRTCYKNQEKACGKCGSCTERLEAFEKNGVPDPIEYEKE
jgi:7-cyano-7-deazaguanine synthase